MNKPTPESHHARNTRKARTQGHAAFVHTALTLVEADDIVTHRVTAFLSAEEAKLALKFVEWLRARTP